MRTCIIRGLLAACLFGGVFASAGDTVYENRGSYVGTFYNNGRETGNEILLGGTAKYLDYFSFEYSLSPASENYNISGRVRFYLNDGNLWPDSQPGSYAQPSTRFFDTDWFPVTLGPQGENRNVLEFTPGDGLPVTGLEMPSTWMTWTVEFTGMAAGDNVGLSIYAPSAEWANNVYADYWENVGGVWSLYSNSTQPTFGAVFQAGMTPVPEPTVAALLLPAGALLGWRAVRRKSGGR